MTRKTVFGFLCSAIMTFSGLSFADGIGPDVEVMSPGSNGFQTADQVADNVYRVEFTSDAWNREYKVQIPTQQIMDSHVHQIALTPNGERNDWSSSLNMPTDESDVSFLPVPDAAVGEQVSFFMNIDPVGAYVMAMDLRNGVNTMDVRKAGDVNDDGIVDMDDVNAIASDLVGLTELEGLDFAVADLNCDGEISYDDGIIATQIVGGNGTYEDCEWNQN